MKKILMLTTMVSLVSSSVAVANDHYNYSRITLGASFTNSEVDDQTIDGNGWLAQGAYELEALPVILGAGLSQSSVDNDELTDGASIDQQFMTLTSHFLISPFDRLDILPGFSIDRTKITTKTNSYNSNISANSYTGLLDLKYHLEDGLWLTAGYAHRQYEGDDFDTTNFYNFGAEYVVDFNWALGLSHQRFSDGYNTNFYIQLFF